MATLDRQPSITPNRQQNKQFYVGLIVSVVLSTLIAVFAHMVGEENAQARIADPATYADHA